MAELVLEVVEGPDSGRQVPLDAAVEIGREPGLAVVLEDTEVSRRHARIEPQGSGAVVSDLDSTNGTYVNDQPVHGSLELDPGDRVRVGLVVLELRTRGEVESHGTAVRPIPDITSLHASVLEPAREEDLSGVFDLSDQRLPSLIIDEVPAEYTAPLDATEERQPGRGDALAALVDGRVKRQTNTVAFALLGVVALGVAVYFGAK